jgi:nucleotide-binding universal stress UspA family protein
MFKKILHATDGSANAFKALGIAVDIAAQYGAELHVILVEEIEPRSGMIEEVQQEKERADRLLHRHEKHVETIAAARHVVPQMHAYAGHPVRTIAAFAKHNAFDLLVIGATGHSDFYETLLGSRADRLMHLAPCSVLVVK